MINAPNTNIMARFLPSIKLTLAAVIFIIPGGITPTIAAKKPKKKGRKIDIYLILKRIYVIALLISKYCFS